MKITVFGTGYVGLVTGVCFAEMGNTVTCVDIDKNKIDLLKKGQSPIYEPGLDELLERNIQSKRLHFTTESQPSIQSAEIIFIAVGTPPQEDGSADLKYVLNVAQEIGRHITSYKVIVNKSTVPVGTFHKVKIALQEQIKQRQLDVNFDVASNPEFLREGCAIEDCLNPNRIVVGVESQKAQDLMQNLYSPFIQNGSQILFMDPASSEMTKYAANAMLATKISLMNEFSRVCEKVGADIEAVRRGIGSDHRIGPHFIYAGIGYGGSCFPKDVSALVKIGAALDENLHILKSVEETNQIQRFRFIKKINQVLTPVAPKTIALWGVAFKPGTDDIREAPSLDIIQNFIDQNIKVRIFDPVASENVKNYFKQNSLLEFFDDQYEALLKADAVIIPTEWKSFREPDFELIKTNLNKPYIFDGRNIYNPMVMKQKGFSYYSIGRPQ